MTILDTLDNVVRVFYPLLSVSLLFVTGAFRAPVETPISKGFEWIDQIIKGFFVMGATIIGIIGACLHPPGALCMTPCFAFIAYSLLFQVYLLKPWRPDIDKALKQEFFINLASSILVFGSPSILVFVFMILDSL